MRIPTARLAALLFVLLPALPAASRADEGMWLFNAPPTAQLKEKYGFEPSADWLNHLQKASVRFNSGGSGSFVSADGLCITNHHVGADALQKFGDEQHNYLHDGFYAKTQAEEKPCLDLELNVLMSIEDVTARVNAAVAAKAKNSVWTPSTATTDALAARRSVIADIEKESKDKTGLRSDVVTLYQGGEYHLYRYKRYTDVRLVFAPEQQAAFYGGDPDNFEYPRYDLDICIFRAYENGQPAHPEQYLKWSPNGTTEHELVFVSGHPGSTSRELTLATLAALRDKIVPRSLAQLYRTETLLTAYSGRSIEDARRARELLFGVQNSRKAFDGRLGGLLDPEFFARLAAKEAGLRSRIDAAYLPEASAAYDNIEKAEAVLIDKTPLYNSLESRRAFLGSNLFGIARTLLRAADERAKPNGERLPELRESGLPSVELQLFSEQPIYDDFEELLLADSLTRMAGTFGANDALVRMALAGKSPRERAVELVTGTRLKDVAVRKKLYEGGAAALKGFSDPMLDFARALDPAARAVRRTFDEQQETQEQAYAQISKARFGLEGTSNYPDATFTLRLSYGTVEGYDGGRQTGGPGVHGLRRAVPPQRGTRGQASRSTCPKRWAEGKDRLKMNTPYQLRDQLRHHRRQLRQPDGQQGG